MRVTDVKSSVDHLAWVPVGFERFRLGPRVVPDSQVALLIQIPGWARRLSTAKPGYKPDLDSGRMGCTAVENNNARPCKRQPLGWSFPLPASSIQLARPQLAAPFHGPPILAGLEFGPSRLIEEPSCPVQEKVWRELVVQQRQPPDMLLRALLFAVLTCDDIHRPPIHVETPGVMRRVGRGRGRTA